MKNSGPEQSDPALRGVLKEWSVTVSLPPGFQEAVWRRIHSTQEHATPSIISSIAHWIRIVAARPALAAAYVALLLAIGMTAGWSQGRQESERIKGKLSERYVRLLDPYQASRQ